MKDTVPLLIEALNPRIVEKLLDAFDQDPNFLEELHQEYSRQWPDRATVFYGQEAPTLKDFLGMFAARKRDGDASPK